MVASTLYLPMVGIGKAIRYGLNMQLEGIYGVSLWDLFALPRLYGRIQIISP